MRSRLQRAIDRRDDAEEEHDKWAFSLSPSERRRSWERVVKLREKVERLRAVSEEGKP